MNRRRPTGHGWPAVLSETPVVLRPYQRGDAAAWARLRRENQHWLAQWEPTVPASWETWNCTRAFRRMLRAQRRAARQDSAMTFAICYQPTGQRERLVGQINVGNVVRRAFCSATVGYWIGQDFAGRGIVPTALALVVDHAFGPAGLHRIEVNVRPENVASRRVVEKLGFRQEARHQRYLHIDGAWRDHIGYALVTEDIVDEGGLLARWRRTRETGTPGPGEKSSPVTGRGVPGENGTPL